MSEGPKPGRRAAHTASALASATDKVGSVVSNQAVAQAFPFASPEVVAALAEQTRTVLQHKFAESWQDLLSRSSFVELCNALDEAEDEGVARSASSSKPTAIPTDPSLSMPALVLPIILPLLQNYQSLVSSQKSSSAALHADIVKRAQEVERLEADINRRCGALKLAVDALDGAGVEGKGVDWERLRAAKAESVERVGESGL